MSDIISACYIKESALTITTWTLVTTHMGCLDVVSVSSMAFLFSLSLLVALRSSSVAMDLYMAAAVLSVMQFRKTFLILFT